MDWTRRVNELHQMARDYDAESTATVAEYPTVAAYIDDLMEVIRESEPELNTDELDVISEELARIYES